MMPWDKKTDDTPKAEKILFIDDPNALWPTEIAAGYLGMSKKSLDNMRCRGSGPEFVLISKRVIRYRRADLDAYVAARKFKSTSEVSVSQQGASKLQKCP